MWKRILLFIFVLTIVLPVIPYNANELSEPRELTLNPHAQEFGLYLDIDYENRLLCNLRQWQTAEMILAGINEAELRVVDSGGQEVSKNETPHTGYRLQKIENGSPIYELSFVLQGDVNGDGTLTSADYMIIKKSFAGQYELEGAYFKAADISGNGELDTVDYARLRAHFAQTYNIFEPGGQGSGGIPAYIPQYFFSVDTLQKEILRAKEDLEQNGRHTDTLLEELDSFYILKNLPDKSKISLINVSEGVVEAHYAVDGQARAIRIFYHRFVSENTVLDRELEENEEIISVNGTEIIRETLKENGEIWGFYYTWHIEGHPVSLLCTKTNLSGITESELLDLEKIEVYEK